MLKEGVGVAALRFLYLGLDLLDPLFGFCHFPLVLGFVHLVLLDDLELLELFGEYPVFEQITIHLLSDRYIVLLKLCQLPQDLTVHVLLDAGQQTLGARLHLDPRG
jgi:hypothetical protein